MDFSHRMTLTGVMTDDGFVRPGLVGAIEEHLEDLDPKKTCILDYFPGAVAREVATRKGAKYQRIEVMDHGHSQFLCNRRDWIRGYFTHVVSLVDLDHIVVVGVPSKVESVIRAFLPERSKLIPLVDRADFSPGMFAQLTFPPRSWKKSPKLCFGTYFVYPTTSATAVA